MCLCERKRGMLLWDDLAKGKDCKCKFKTKRKGARQHVIYKNLNKYRQNRSLNAESR